MTYIPPANGGRINLTIGGNTAGVGSLVSTGTATLVGGNNITLSQNGNAITIAGAAASPTNTMDFYQNMDRGVSTVLAVPYNSTGGASLMLQRLNQENSEFAAYLTANTVLMNMSASLTAVSASTGAHSMTAYIGVYADNTTALNLINSASSSWGISANSNNSSLYNGIRWLSFVSSQWSSSPVFVQGSEYVFGVFLKATNVAMPMSYIGQSYMASAQRSGSIGAASIATSAASSLAQGNYWNAVYSTNVTAFPATIASNAVSRSGSSAAFIPHVVLNNRYPGIF